MCYLACRDILSLKDNMRHGDFDYLNSILFGDGWVQYNNLTDNEIDIEFIEMTYMLREELYNKEIKSYLKALFSDEFSENTDNDLETLEDEHFYGS